MITLFSLSNSDLFTSAKNSGFYSRVKHFCVGKSQIYVSIFVGKSRMPTQIRMAVYYCVVSCGPLHTTMGIHPASMTSSTFSKKESLCRFMWIFFFVFVRVRLIMKENEKSYNYQLMNLSNQLLLSIMVVQDTESK